MVNGAPMYLPPTLYPWQHFAILRESPALPQLCLMKNLKGEASKSPLNMTAVGLMQNWKTPKQDYCNGY